MAMDVKDVLQEPCNDQQADELEAIADFTDELCELQQKQHELGSEFKRRCLMSGNKLSMESMIMKAKLDVNNATAGLRAIELVYNDPELRDRHDNDDNVKGIKIDGRAGKIFFMLEEGSKNE